MGAVEILNKLLIAVVSEQNLGEEQASHVDFWGKSIRARENKKFLRPRGGIVPVM